MEAKFTRYRLQRTEKWEKLGREPTLEDEMKEVTQKAWFLPETTSKCALKKGIKKGKCLVLS
ncbi:MAG TPA: hypothetical protein VE130_04705 [Nitrososphaeraceae archaeon]|nr:hypothetical protein [Nitrososphaeraceae archaeon]